MQAAPISGSRPPMLGPQRAPKLLPKLPPLPDPPLDSGDLSLVLESDALRHAELAVEDYIKNELNLRLDTDAQLCHANLSPAGCPKGPSCPYRHARPSPKNFRPPSPKPFNAHAFTVCKHWLRGLCKKGQACDFLHEYNLRKMPECYNFSTNGYCPSGDECMYLHNGPRERRPECKNFVRGFCPTGPACPYKHIRRIACPLYLTGFCPRGAVCHLAHPPWQLPEVDRAIERAKAAKAEMYKTEGGEGEKRPGAPTAARNNNITCFKCGQKGHWANMCPNPMVPGLRGGVERGAGGRVIQATPGVTVKPPHQNYGV